MKKYLIASAILILIVLVFVIFPRAGLYARLFDSDTYPPLSTESLVKDLSQLSPKTRALAEEFLKEAKRQGLKVMITETYRTQERQDLLYAKGRTQPGRVVTWTKNSKHSSRRAFDIAEDSDDPYGDPEFFRRCAEIAKDIGLSPGFYWKVRDAAHMEFNAWWLP